MPRRHPAPSAALALLAVLACGQSLALPEDRRQPIQLEADQAELDQRTGISRYRGNVVITQGTMQLRADVVTIHMDEGEFSRLEAEGAPARFRVQPAAGRPEAEGSGRRIDYDVAGGLIVFRQAARITQARDVFTGEHIEYDLEQDVVRARAASGDADGRVQITLQPRSKAP